MFNLKKLPQKVPFLSKSLLFALILTIVAMVVGAFFVNDTVLAMQPQAESAQIEANGVNNSTELLIYDENRVVTVADRGFPRDDPPRPSANGNWKTPVNYAEGTLYFRVQIRNQPRPQNMRIQFCMWQYNFSLENCGSQHNVSGTSGTVVTWSQPVQDMWKLNGKPMDWVNPRQRYGTAIKNSAGDPVSNYNGWNWNGENPNHWYPLDMRHTVVVVAKGESFSGWQNYVGGSGGGSAPTNTPQPSNPTPTNTPVPNDPTPTNTPQPSNPPTGSSGGVVANGNFENGSSNWSFYSARGGSFSTNGSGYNSPNGGHITIDQANNNVQLYQHGIQLKPNTNYKLSFWGYSNTGHDLNVYLHKHQAPYTFYGLSEKINLGTGWNKHEVPFTTQGFGGNIDNARLRFWLSSYGTAGDNYYFDDIQIEEVGGSGGSQPTPTPTPTDPSEPPVSGSGGGTGGSNHVSNGSFESGSSFWSYHSRNHGSFTLVNSNIDGAKGGRVSINSAGSNIQLYQNGISLKPNTGYRLSFYAYSNSGHDLDVFLHKHVAPYTKYGLSKRINLTNAWKQYVIEFTTPQFNGIESNARLRFWLSNAARAGDRYFFDDIVLTELSGGSTASYSSSMQPLSREFTEPEASDTGELDITELPDEVSNEDATLPSEEQIDTSETIFLPFTSN